MLLTAAADPETEPKGPVGARYTLLVAPEITAREPMEELLPVLPATATPDEAGRTGFSGVSTCAIVRTGLPEALPAILA